MRSREFGRGEAGKDDPVTSDSRAIARYRVHKAFSSTAGVHDGHEDQDWIEYLRDLRGRMKDISESSRRTVLLMLLVAATFELLDRAAVTNVQAGPFQIKDLSLIQRVLPVIFAYLIYEETVLGVRYLYSMSIASEIARTFQPALKSSTLDGPLNPQGSPLFGPMLWHRSASRSYRLLALFTIVLRLGSLTAPLIIEAYAFYRLFRLFGAGDIIVWISVIFSFGFTLFAALVILTGLQDGLIRWKSLLGPH